MKDKVKEGYEEGKYDKEYREGVEIRNFERKLFEKLFEEIPSKASVLDLGCGTGIPFDKFLVEQGYRVTGIDFVDEYIQKAKENLPEAEFKQADFSEIDFPEGLFDAVVSFYSIFHIPREEHLKLLVKVNSWLKDSGIVLLTMGAEEMNETEADFAGSKMVWSSFSLEKNEELIQKAGFNILESYEETGEEHHLWILAKKT